MAINISSDGEGSDENREGELIKFSDLRNLLELDEGTDEGEQEKEEEEEEKEEESR